MTFKNIHNRFLEMPMTKYMLIAIFGVFILSILSFEPIDPTFLAKYTLESLTPNKVLKAILTVPILLLNLYITIKLMVALPLWVFSLPFKNRGSIEIKTRFQLLGCLTSVALLLIIFTDFSAYGLFFQMLYGLIIYYTYLLFKQRKDFSPFWATVIVMFLPSILFIIPNALNF